MTPKNTEDPHAEDSLGVLDDAASVDTGVLGIIGGTAQVSVTMPQEDDDDLADDGVLDDEVAIDLVLDTEALEPMPASAVAALALDGPAITKPAVPESVPVTEDIPAEDEIPAEDVASSEDDAPEEAVLDEDAVSADVPDEALPAVEDVIIDESPSAESASAAEASDQDSPVEELAVEELPVVEAEIEDVPVEEEPVIEPAASASEPEPTASEPQPEPAASEPEPEPVASEPRPVTEPEPAPAVAPAPTASAPTASAPEPPETKSAAASTPPETPAAPKRTRASVRTDLALSSKRLGEIDGDSHRESADLLTADRLLDPQRQTKPEPEGAWSHFLYTVSGRRINIGDGRKARERKALSARIAAPLPGGARFVPVLSRKGGVGKTTITALLGMALADAREDRVIAVDANPDRGTLADRVVHSPTSKSVRDLARIHDEVRGYNDISAIVARDATRLDVLASDADPRIAQAFSDSDYRDVAGVAAHYYSLVLTDTGTGIVHSVMSATLDLADQIVIVSGLSVDEARLASETLTWLETNGHAEQARNAIVVLNQSTPGAPLVRLNELEAHFATRARTVVRMPYDAQIAGGGTIVFAHLQPETRAAARGLAALLVEGLRARAA